jgi:hypothetical protein
MYKLKDSILKAIKEYHTKIVVWEKRSKQDPTYTRVTFMRSGTQQRGRKSRAFDGWDNNHQIRPAIIDGRKFLMV